MATRACVKILLSSAVRRELTCSTSSIRKLSTHPCTKLSKYAQVLHSANSALVKHYCTKSAGDESTTYRCMLRGLPWGATEGDVNQFLDGVVAKSVSLKYDRIGRFTGNVHIDFESEGDLKATLAKDGQYIGHRYVNVIEFDSETERDNFYQPVKDTRYEESVEDGGGIVLKCRGFPWRISDKIVREFFGGIKLRRIDYLHNSNGLFSGTLFVELESEVDLHEALKRHGETISNRHIEVYRGSSKTRDELSSLEFARYVKVMNLPYSCTRGEIRNFFSGLEIEPNGIKLPLNKEMRPLGIALVKFTDHEMAAEAEKRSGQVLGNREITVRKWVMATQNAPGSRRGQTMSETSNSQ